MLSGALPHQAESIARKYVALHLDDVQAWRELLVIIDRNGRQIEVQRLAGMAMQRFPNEPVFRHQNAVALAKQGDIEAAIEQLDFMVYKSRTASPPEALFLATLLISRNPLGAEKLCDAILHRLPLYRDALQLKRSVRSINKNVGKNKLIFFHVAFDWHALVQESIVQACEARGLPFFLSNMSWLAGVCNAGAIVISEANLVLSSELSQVAPSVPVINTRHGISVNGKNYGLYAAAAVDHVCASSPWIADELSRLALLPPERIWVTGYAQMDSMFRQCKPAASQASPAEKHRVLVASTFNTESNAAIMLGDNPVAAIRGADERIHVTLAMHPHMRINAPQLVACWKALASNTVNVSFFDSSECNILEKLPEVDVLIADTTSVATQFIGLDRPLIRLIPASQPEGFAFCPDEFDADMEAASITLHDTKSLQHAVKRALTDAEPESIRSARKRLSDKLFGTLTDGRAGERICKNLEALVYGRR